MSSFIQSPKLCCPIISCKKTRFSHSFRITAQIPRDNNEGRWSRIVDANLHLLKARIEEVREKERCCVAEQGWNYDHENEKSRIKRRKNSHKEMAAEFVEILGMAASAFGFTILGCTFCLCIISFLFHLNQSPLR